MCTVGKERERGGVRCTNRRNGKPSPTVMSPLSHASLTASLARSLGVGWRVTCVWVRRSPGPGPEPGPGSKAPKGGVEIWGCTHVSTTSTVGKSPRLPIPAGGAPAVSQRLQALWPKAPEFSLQLGKGAQGLSCCAGVFRAWL